MDKLTISIILFLFVTIFQVKADIWDTPGTKYYYSENNTFMLKVVLTKYLKNRKSLPEKNTTSIQCNGTLYKISGADTTIIWKKKLINKICPVTAIVSNDGSSIVTFDNWYSKSYGNDLMVVYNELGDLKRRFQFEDISPFPIKSYPRSKSSLLLMSDEKYIGNDRIEICFQNEKEVIMKRIFNVKKLVFEK